MRRLVALLGALVLVACTDAGVDSGSSDTGQDALDGGEVEGPQQFPRDCGVCYRNADGTARWEVCAAEDRFAYHGGGLDPEPNSCYCEAVELGEVMGWCVPSLAECECILDPEAGSCRFDDDHGVSFPGCGCTQDQDAHRSQWCMGPAQREPI